MTKSNVVSHQAYQHQKVSMDVIRSLPIFAVRVPPNQKDPGHYGWDPKTNSAEKSAQTLDTVLKSNNSKAGPDNLGIHLFGAVIDIDVDTDDPMTAEALEYFMPATAHVWGRASRPKTHRLYQVAGDMGSSFDPKRHRFLQALEKREEIKVEMRGGEQKSGRYTLMPGSLHPSGEIYEWTDIKAAQSSPATVDLRNIVRGLKFACVASLMARHWNEGIRNDLCQALSGFLFRAHQNSMEMAEADEIPFEFSDAEHLLEGIMEIADDDEGDRHMRLSTLKKTWEKAESGAPVTGATRLKELTQDNEIVSLLYLLLANSPDLERLDEFMSRFAYWRNTSSIFDMDMLGIKGARAMMSVQDMRNSYKSEKLTRADGGFIPLAEIYLDSAQKIVVDRIDIHPEEGKLYTDDQGFLVVNEWTGLATEPYEGEVSDADVQMFLDYVKNVVSNENEKMNTWVLSWIADLFIDPLNKSGTALVLVGKTGTGKSTLGVTLRRIIGPNHSMASNDVADITSNFNKDSVGQLFVQLDEATNSNQRKDANKLKAMITDPDRRLEPKGVDAYQVQDFARYLFTSNEMKNAVAIVDGQDDRRYTIQSVNPKYGKSSNLTTFEEKRSYWKKYNDWLNEVDTPAKILKWLLQYPRDKDLIRESCATKTKDEMAHTSLRGIDAWLLDMASLDHPLERLRHSGKEHSLRQIHPNGGYRPDVDGWPEIVSKTGLMESYARYSRTRKYHNGEPDYNVNQIAVELVGRGLLANTKTMIRKVRQIDDRTGELIGKSISKRMIKMFSREELKTYMINSLGYVMPEDGEIMNEEAPYGGERDESEEY